MKNYFDEYYSNRYAASDLSIFTQDGELELMVDFETLDTLPTSAVLSVAIVPFTLDGQIFADQSFYSNISLNDCIKHGLTIDESTFMWWLSMSESARLAITSRESQSLSDLFAAIDVWVTTIKQRFKTDKLFIWGNGASFDLAIMRNACSKTSTKWMFLPSAEQDVRTVVRFKPEVKKTLLYQGVQHDPVFDCIHQCKYVTETYNCINVK